MTRNTRAFLFKLLRGTLTITGAAALSCGALVGFLFFLLFLNSSVHGLTATGDNLRMGQLASIPPSATGFQIGAWSSLCSSACYMRFPAPPEEIEAFIQRSPGIRGVKPERFGPGHMYLSDHDMPRDIDAYERWAKHRRFHPAKGYPWFDPSIREKGRRYPISLPDAVTGYVAVDDLRHMVFIKIDRS
jgi:hypothetical protein